MITRISPRRSLRRAARAVAEFWSGWFTWRSSIAVAVCTVCMYWFLGASLADSDGIDTGALHWQVLRATLSFELAAIYTRGAIMAIHALRNDGVRRMKASFATTLGRSQISKDVRALQHRLEALERRPVSLESWDRLVEDTMALDTEFINVWGRKDHGIPYGRIHKCRRRLYDLLDVLRAHPGSAAALDECRRTLLGDTETTSAGNGLCVVTVRFDTTALDRSMLLAHARPGGAEIERLYPLHFGASYLVHGDLALLRAWLEQTTVRVESDLVPCPDGIVDLVDGLWDREPRSIYHDPARAVAAAGRLERAARSRGRS